MEGGRKNAPRGRGAARRAPGAGARRAQAPGARRRGAKVLTRRDWLFGSRPRRIALEALLAEGPGEAWSKARLARAAGVSPHGGIDEHVAGFVDIGLLERRDGGYALADPPPPYLDSLTRLLRELRGLPDEA